MFNKLKIRFQLVLLGLRILFYQLFKSTTYNSIIICGDKGFQKVSIEALNLVKEKAADAMDLIQKNIGFICQYKSSGIFSSVQPSICTIKKDSISHSIAYYSSILCHESYHVFLYHDFKKNNPQVKEVPVDVYSGINAETKCMEYARKIMEKMGIDVNGLPPINEVIDSKWWEIPWEKQDW